MRWERGERRGNQESKVQLPLNLSDISLTRRQLPTAPDLLPLNHPFTFKPDGTAYERISLHRIRLGLPIRWLASHRESLLPHSVGIAELHNQSSNVLSVPGHLFGLLITLHLHRLEPPKHSRGKELY